MLVTVNSSKDEHDHLGHTSRKTCPWDQQSQKHFDTFSIWGDRNTLVSFEKLLYNIISSLPLNANSLNFISSQLFAKNLMHYH